MPPSPAWISPSLLFPTRSRNLNPHTPKASLPPPPIPRRTFIHLLATVLAVPHLPQSAHAICGAPDPAFTHYLDWSEGVAPLSDRQVHYRIVGNKKKERKAGKYPVLYIGDGGIALQSGETLELLGVTDRRVITVDFFGVGDSSPLQTFDNPVEVGKGEANAVLQAAGIEKVHVVAAGSGILVAEELTKEGSVVSAAVEGWSAEKGSGREMSFVGLQGDRICAVEGAKGGDLGVVRKLNDGRGFVAAVERIAKSVPCIAVGTGKEAELQGVRVVRVGGDGRLAHLADTENCLGALDTFFETVEAATKV